MISPYLAYEKDAVSIITCTRRRQNMDTLFHNYDRQNYRNKELIVILNHPSLKLSDYIRAALPYPNVRVYSLPGHVSLGSCLNYGVKMARYGLIAKFDDDDYYAWLSVRQPPQHGGYPCRYCRQTRPLHVPER